MKEGARRMANKKPAVTMKKDDSFDSVAKRLECEDDKEAFEKKLGKIAKAKPMKAPRA